MSKRCTTCKAEKDESEFNRHTKIRGGRQPRCRECQRAAYRARQRYDAQSGGVLRCSRCGVEKPTSEFCKSGTNKSGYHCYCKACHATYYRDKGYDYVRDYRKQLRRDRHAFIAQHKTELGCADCGERHPGCLDFHHRDPSQKRFIVSQMPGSYKRFTVIEAEIAKCDVLCANCHRKRHWTERQERARETA